MAQFGEALGFASHALDPDRPSGQDQRFAHGYLLENGEVMAIMDVEMTTTRLGITPIIIDALVTDQRGHKHQLRGVPLAGAPWRAYGNAICWIGLFRWELRGQMVMARRRKTIPSPLMPACAAAAGPIVFPRSPLKNGQRPILPPVHRRQDGRR